MDSVPEKDIEAWRARWKSHCPAQCADDLDEPHSKPGRLGQAHQAPDERRVGSRGADPFRSVAKAVFTCAEVARGRSRELRPAERARAVPIHDRLQKAPGGGAKRSRSPPERYRTAQSARAQPTSARHVRVAQPDLGRRLHQQRRRRPLAGPRAARVVQRVVHPRQRAIRPGVGLDRRELPMRVTAPGVQVEAQERAAPPGAPAAPGRYSFAFSSQPVHQTRSKSSPSVCRCSAAADEIEVRRAVHDHPGSRWTIAGRETEERDDAIDVDEEYRFAGIFRGQVAYRRNQRGLSGYPTSCGSVNPAGAGADDKDSPRLPLPDRSHHTSLHDAQLGILFALLCAVGSYFAFFLKHRGVCSAPSVDIRRPLQDRRRAVVVPLVRHRHGRRRACLADARGGLSLAPMSTVQAVVAGGVALIAVMADRIFGMRVSRRQWWGLGLTAAGLVLLARDDAGQHRRARVVLPCPDDRLRGRAPRDRRPADRRPARRRRPRRAPRRRARDRLGRPLRRLQRLREGPVGPRRAPRRARAPQPLDRRRALRLGRRLLRLGPQPSGR